MGKIIIGGSSAPRIVEPELQKEPSVEIAIPEVRIQTVERLIEVPVQVPVEVPVDRVIKEIVYVDKPLEIVKETTVEKIVEVPVEVIKIVEKQVEVPVEVIKEVTVERIVEVPVEVVREVQVIKKIVPKWAMMIAAVEFAIITLLLMSRS
jgi:hypothetical protein